MGLVVMKRYTCDGCGAKVEIRPQDRSQTPADWHEFKVELHKNGQSKSLEGWICSRKCLQQAAGCVSPAGHFPPTPKNEAVAPA